ncbi:MAG: hypothetical protein M3Y87_20680, partial [Myxococcota bacterium]|nr:hypothetical protein [Myxococcota bacterium]
MHAGAARGWSATLLVLASATAMTAHAQPSEPAYEAPPSCPDAAEFRARLAASLASAPPDAELPDLRASVRISERDGAYAAEVVLVEGGSELRRSLRDTSCAVVAEAAMMVVAIALVPGLDPLGAPAPARADPLAEPASPAPERGGITLGGA